MVDLHLRDHGLDRAQEKLDGLVFGSGLAFADVSAPLEQAAIDGRLSASMTPSLAP
ncbi:hypothetical protein FQZ97_1051100 [compost metagenome]